MINSCIVLLASKLRTPEVNLRFLAVLVRHDAVDAAVLVDASEEGVAEMKKERRRRRMKKTARQEEEVLAQTKKSLV